MLPGSEVATLPIVTFIGEVHLWPDEQHLPIQDKDAAVVTHTPVNDRHAHIHHHVLAVLALQKGSKTLPRVINGVWLQEMVIAAIPGDLKLRTDAVSCARSFGLHTNVMLRLWALIHFDAHLNDRHAYIHRHVLAVLALQKGSKTLQRVINGVCLQEMVIAAIPGDLKLRTDAVSCARSFGLHTNVMLRSWALIHFDAHLNDRHAHINRHLLAVFTIAERPPRHSQ
jgi:hypothetical protein